MQNTLLLTDDQPDGLRVWCRIGGTNPGFAIEESSQHGRKRTTLRFIRATKSWQRERQQILAEAHALAAQRGVQLHAPTVTPIVVGDGHPHPAVSRDQQALLDRGFDSEYVWGESITLKRDHHAPKD